ncbi:MAG: hypothetical protein HON98_02415 [Chloroflexi bacterium]|jgi:hypothetical protein|nr:hypothetical protein [Chloroflexota bacterium]MBT3668697.1 hypothetical protein [Chloroflexota bacterium]MBT4003862.1 hypothetical protein [Chloroflexota bacterium]MBT4305398.1 hypothetical protein [Chloroflexota bacterium]MBT4532544.1 hypothetical protein [Chloroflexota bacterium]
MSKLDLSKKYKEFFTAKKDPVLIDVPPTSYIMIDGRGEPGGEEYVAKVGALYNMAYKVKFQAKEMEKDFVVCKLQGLWWFDDYNKPTPPREEWNWTMMLRQPEYVTEEMVAKALEMAYSKKPVEELKEVKLVEYHEGLSAQIMHYGPYSEEEPTIERLHNFVAEQGFNLRGKHHEVYLKDPFRSAPEKLLTIIRHPVE